MCVYIYIFFFVVVALQTSEVYAYKKLPMIKKNKLDNKSHYFVEFKTKENETEAYCVQRATPETPQTKKSMARG